MISFNKKMGDVFVVGFALFAMFLGAGNLIFPPTLGHIVGNAWLQGFLGFFVTGVGMPFLGIVAMSKCGGSIEVFAGKIHPLFAKAFGAIIVIIIGPLFAVPRTAATTHEIAVLPFFPNVSPIVTTVVFFGVVLLVLLTPNDVLDKIGKYLTPFLLLVLSIIIIKAIVSPISVPTEKNESFAFLRGFKEGYQTMDALGSTIVAILIISGIKARGYNKANGLVSMSIMAGLVAVIGLGIVYGGLLYIGASAGNAIPDNLSRVEFLVACIQNLLGSNGHIILAISIGLACLTTAIGLISTAGRFFEELFQKKISYKTLVIIFCLISSFIATLGVDPIVQFAVPILEIMYPVCIVLIFMNLFSEKIPNRYFFIGAVIGTLCISILAGFVSLAGVGIPQLDTTMNSTASAFTTTQKVLEGLPFYSVGFSWIIPATVLSLVMGFGYMLLKKSNR